MRVGFPLMLAISLALHAAVAIGFLIDPSRWSRNMAPTAPEATSTLVLMGSPELPQPPPVAVSPASSPVLPPPISEKTGKLASDSKTISPTPTVTETNPNANAPQPKPETVLAPVPPPVLNNSHGVVFVLDVSGSMYEPFAGSTRLAFARQDLARRIRALKDGTPFAITVYAQTARTSGPLVAAGNETREAAVRFVMEDFDCGGGTDLPSGLASAQQLHAGHIVLVSDGDLNIRQTDLSAHARRLLGLPGHSPALSIVGICPRSNTDAERLLQGLADQQDGSYSVEKADGTTALYTAGKNVDSSR